MQQQSQPVDTRARARSAGLLAGMRIRKKLIFLHTCFSLVLAGVLALALRPAIAEVVRRAELHEARLVVRAALRESTVGVSDTSTPGGRVEVRRGEPGEIGVSPEAAAAAKNRPGEPVELESQPEGVAMVAFDAVSGQYVAARALLTEARDAVLRLYLLVTVALLAIYALVAAALEVFVLPQQVYEPIRRLREADRAVEEGRRAEELIEESAIPADELGEIMRSRNRSILTIRRHERDLAEAARQLGEAASDLKRKNHLLETAKQNLADADRLASLGMMSAGLSHEMNTPLTVLKGLAEKLSRTPEQVSADEAELMLRVVGRLERLSESLLDFARVRPPATAPADLRSLADEAWTLVRLDRDASQVTWANAIPPGTVVECDGDRIVQVLVNVIRNAADVLDGKGSLAAAAERVERDGRGWVSVTITDDGPGIAPEVLGRLFEPFVSTRLDSRGTGLGLAVAEGIVKEHGGLILARNRRDGSGAVFEILLPAQTNGGTDPAAGHGRSANPSRDLETRTATRP